MFMENEVIFWIHASEKQKQDKVLELVNVRLNDDEKFASYKEFIRYMKLTTKDSMKKYYEN